MPVWTIGASHKSSLVLVFCRQSCALDVLAAPLQLSIHLREGLLVADCLQPPQHQYLELRSRSCGILHTWPDICSFLFLIVSNTVSCLLPSTKLLPVCCWIQRDRCCRDTGNMLLFRPGVNAALCITPLMSALIRSSCHRTTDVYVYVATRLKRKQSVFRPFSSVSMFLMHRVRLQRHVSSTCLLVKILISNATVANWILLRRLHP